MNNKLIIRDNRDCKLLSGMHEAYPFSNGSTEATSILFNIYLKLDILGTSQFIR